MNRTSVCGSVGKTFASDTRGSWFESSRRQNLYQTFFTVNCIEKTKIKKKRPGIAHFLTMIRTRQSNAMLK